MSRRWGLMDWTGALLQSAQSSPVATPGAPGAKDGQLWRRQDGFLTGLRTDTPAVLSLMVSCGMIQLFISSGGFIEHSKASPSWVRG